MLQDLQFRETRAYSVNIFFMKVKPTGDVMDINCINPFYPNDFLCLNNVRLK